MLGMDVQGGSEGDDTPVRVETTPELVHWRCAHRDELRGMNICDGFSMVFVAKRISRLENTRCV